MNLVYMSTQATLFTPTELLQLKNIVQKAGKIGLSYFGKNIKNWQKADDTPITEADLAVNDFLETELKSFRPEYGWLSEETTDNEVRLAKQYLWVVDPIDGTKAFINAKPEWVVSVAIVRDSRPILGLIYDPIAEILYFAEQNQGAFSNGVKIEPSQKTNVYNCNILAYEFHFERMTKRSDYIWPEMNYDIVNSMAMRVVLVASGKFDAMVSFTNKGEWDMAAADIIIHEAGGLITDGFGNLLTYNKPIPKLPHMVAAGVKLHKSIITHTINFDFPSENIFK